MKQVIESINAFGHTKSKRWIPRFCRRPVSDAVGKREAGGGKRFSYSPRLW